MSTKEAGWWTKFFVDFRPIFGTIDPKTTKAQAKYIIKKLDLKAGKTFLDCPSGIGRLSFPIARTGAKVTCVDLTKSYLDEIDIKTKQAKLKIKTVNGDMRRVNFKSQFDTAGNLGTSIGYFPKESDNFVVLKKMYQALKPGGKFVVHVSNRDWIVANFQKRDWLELGNNSMLVQDRTFNFETSVLKAIWTYYKDGLQKSYDVTIRLYSFHELAELFRKAGFVDIEGFGSVMDDPVSQQSRTMWVFGTKPRK